MKNLCHFEMGGGSGKFRRHQGGCSMLTVADKREGG